MGRNRWGCRGCRGIIYGWIHTAITPMMEVLNPKPVTLNPEPANPPMNQGVCGNWVHFAVLRITGTSRAGFQAL